MSKQLTLSSNASVSKNANSSPDVVFPRDGITRIFPFPSLLLLVQVDVVVIVDEIGHDDPFCNLRTVDAICAAQRDLAVRVDGVLGYVVGAGRDELDELDVGHVGCFLREPGDGDQNIDTF